VISRGIGSSLKLRKQWGVMWESRGILPTVVGPGEGVPPRKNLPEMTYSGEV